MHKQTNVLAVGNSKNEIVLMDAERFAPIQVLKDQHQGRVSSLAWNPAFTSVLSSGSIDSQILNNDVRMP
jgi:WD40 repeat protein